MCAGLKENSGLSGAPNLFQFTVLCELNTKKQEKQENHWFHVFFGFTFGSFTYASGTLSADRHWYYASISEPHNTISLHSLKHLVWLWVWHNKKTDYWKSVGTTFLIFELKSQKKFCTFECFSQRQKTTSGSTLCMNIFGNIISFQNLNHEGWFYQ